MLPERQLTLTASLTSDIVYHEPAVVFAHWYNKFRMTYPGERPTEEWLSQNSKLPLSTCGWYRRRYEAFFPEAYAVAQVNRNLRLSRRQRKKSFPPRNL